MTVGANSSNGNTIARVDRLAARHAANKPSTTNANKLLVDLGWTDITESGSN